MICLKALSELVPELSENEPSSSLSKNSSSSGTKWLESLIFLWAMGGDYISKEYSGTESVLTKITLKGYQN